MTAKTVALLGLLSSMLTVHANVNEVRLGEWEAKAKPRYKLDSSQKKEIIYCSKSGELKLGDLVPTILNAILDAETSRLIPQVNNELESRNAVAILESWKSHIEVQSRGPRTAHFDDWKNSIDFAIEQARGQSLFRTYTAVPSLAQFVLEAVAKDQLTTTLVHRSPQSQREQTRIELPHDFKVLYPQVLAYMDLKLDQEVAKSSELELLRNATQTKGTPTEIIISTMRTDAGVVLEGEIWNDDNQFFGWGKLVLETRVKEHQTSNESYESRYVRETYFDSFGSSNEASVPLCSELAMYLEAKLGKPAFVLGSTLLESALLHSLGNRSVSLGSASAELQRFGHGYELVEQSDYCLYVPVSYQRYRQDIGLPTLLYQWKRQIDGGDQTHLPFLKVVIASGSLCYNNVFFKEMRRSLARKGISQIAEFRDSHFRIVAGNGNGSSADWNEIIRLEYLDLILNKSSASFEERSIARLGLKSPFWRSELALCKFERREAWQFSDELSRSRLILKENVTDQALSWVQRGVEPETFTVEFAYFEFADLKQHKNPIFLKATRND